MDYFPEIETLSQWLLQYGAFALFILLAIGIIALPVPEETLMVVAGILMNNGNLHIPHVIIAAFAGSICGITGSYLLGRLASNFFIQKIGRWVGITEARFQAAQKRFEPYGKWALFIGYFIPGIRHLSGFSAGVAKLNYKEFALFAYSGAFAWVSLFLSVGYFFGDYWFVVYEKFFALI